MGLFNDQKNVTNVDSFGCLDENNKPKEFDENVMDLVFILDKSGSMIDLVDDTIGGFNSYIEKEKEKGENILVTLILFDTEYTVLYSRKPISEVEKLTRDEYFACGCTALLDAIGRTVTTYDRVVNSAMCVITTDGYENSSREFNRDQIKDMVQNSGWEFVFIGADIDSYGEASRIGIRSSRVARHRKDSKGFDDMYNAVNNLTTKFYFERDTKDNSDDWKEDLE